MSNTNCDEPVFLFIRTYVQTCRAAGRLDLQVRFDSL